MIGSIVIPINIVFIESTIRSEAYVRKREASNRDERLYHIPGPSLLRFGFWSHPLMPQYGVPLVEASSVVPLAHTFFLDFASLHGFLSDLW